MVASCVARLLRVGFLTTALFTGSSAEDIKPDLGSVPQLVAVATSQLAGKISEVLRQAETNLGKNNDNETPGHYFEVPGTAVPISASNALERLERRLHTVSDEISQWATANEGRQAILDKSAEDANSRESAQALRLQHAIDRVRASTREHASAVEAKVAELEAERHRLVADLSARGDSFPVDGRSPTTRGVSQGHGGAPVHLENYLGLDGALHDAKVTPQPAAHTAAVPNIVVKKVAGTEAHTAKRVSSAERPQVKNSDPSSVATTASGPPAPHERTHMSNNLKLWLSGRPLVTRAPLKSHRKPKAAATNSHLLAARDLIASIGSRGQAKKAAHAAPQRPMKPHADRMSGTHSTNSHLLDAEKIIGRAAEGLHHRHHHRQKEA